MEQLCPRCATFSVVWIDHDNEEGPHQYCKNCDYGVCEFC